METISLNVYSFDELSKEAQDKAVMDQVKVEIELMDENSPYYKAALEMKKNQTPWFLAETLYFDYRESIEETIRLNEYKFYENGEFYSH